MSIVMTADDYEMNEHRYICEAIEVGSKELNVEEVFKRINGIAEGFVKEDKMFKRDIRALLSRK